jgi:hypothetical protein
MLQALHKRLEVCGQELMVPLALGSRLIDRQSQKMTVAASATAERKVFAHRS